MTKEAWEGQCVMGFHFPCKSAKKAERLYHDVVRHMEKRSFPRALGGYRHDGESLFVPCAFQGGEPLAIPPGTREIRWYKQERAATMRGHEPGYVRKGLGTMIRDLLRAGKTR